MALQSTEVSAREKVLQTPKAQWEAVAAQDLDYHLRQFREPYRSTKALGRFLVSRAGKLGGCALDVGCGAGASIFYLSQLLPELQWTGIDLAGDILFQHSRTLFSDQQIHARLVSGDFYHLTDLFGGKKFDLVLSLQILHVLPSYEKALEQLLAVSSKWVVITSLLSEFLVDAKIETTDHTWPAEVSHAYYNVYSFPRLRAFCEAHGAKEVIAQDFDIDIDLPVPTAGGLGTYTRTLETGKRLQFTGPVYMPWKFVLVRMA
ncbi:MAG: class I SAM-dependent methyltransferase [Acidobacteriaceae bacterium]|nr:class I SAM-dependent methyltransferase [Acidobacteriaceae bacterium]